MSHLAYHPTFRHPEVEYSYTTNLLVL